MKYDYDFWSAIDTLVSSGKIVIDRPKGSTHPRFPHIRYDVDYGYIQNTTSMDGDGIDVWKGSLSSVNVNAIICTVDLLKRDSEAVYVDAPDKSSGKRRQKVHIEYDLVGYIPVDELLKAEQA